jgi:hypothetical protein
MVNYRGMPLSAGNAGDVHGGDRLPWVPDGPGDNYAPLRAIGWQAHVYGRAADDLGAACATHGLPLHVFPWSGAHGSAGLERDALYLLRPDTYVALAARVADPGTLTRYFGERGLRYAPRD